MEFSGSASKSWPIQLTIMTICLHLWCCCVCVRAAPNGRKDRVVYWNATSSVFEQSLSRGGFLVAKNDRLVIVCPASGNEFYKIYWTHNFTAAKECRSDAPHVFFLLGCREAGSTGAYLVTDFSPIPDAPSFDRPVYLFSPSTGDQAGLERATGGACLQRRMRLMVAVGDPDSQPPRPPRPPPIEDSPMHPAYPPLPSARQTPLGSGGFQDVAKLDSKNLRLITGSPPGVAPSPRLVAAAVATSTILLRLLRLLK